MSTTAPLRQHRFPENSELLPAFENGGFERPENATSYVSAKSLSSLFSEVAAFSADTPLPDGYAKLDGLRLASPNFDFRDNDATRPYLAVKMTDALQARWTEYAKGIHGIRAERTPTPSFTLSKYNTGDWSLKLIVPTSPGYPSTPLYLGTFSHGMISALARTIDLPLDPIALKHHFPDLPRSTQEPLYVVTLGGLANHVIAGQLQDGALTWPKDLPEPCDHLTLELNTPDEPHRHLIPRDLDKGYLSTSPVMHVPLYRQSDLYDAYKVLKHHSFMTVEAFLKDHAPAIAHHQQGPKPLMATLPEPVIAEIQAIIDTGMEDSQKRRQIAQCHPSLDDDRADEIMVVGPQNYRATAKTLFERCQEAPPLDAVFSVLEHATLYNTEVAYRQSATALATTLENADPKSQLRVIGIVRSALSDPEYQKLNAALQPLDGLPKEVKQHIHNNLFSYVTTAMRQATPVGDHKPVDQKLADIARDGLMIALRDTFTSPENRGIATSLALVEALTAVTQEQVKPWLNEALRKTFALNEQDLSQRQRLRR